MSTAAMRKVCVVGASGKLGTLMVEECLKRGYEVVGVCREESVGKLDTFKDRITIVPGRTNNEEVIKKAIAGCDGVLTVLVPMGFDKNSSGTAHAILTHCEPNSRLIFSCGAHITKDGKDTYAWSFHVLVFLFGILGRLFWIGEIEDQVEACREIFASDRRWTVVRADNLNDDPPQGLPVWSHHYGDPILESSVVCRRDFAHFMVDALTNDALEKEAPAIVGCKTPSALKYGPSTNATGN